MIDLNLRIYGNFTDEAGTHEYHDYMSNEFSEITIQKTLCSGGAKIGNAAMGTMTVICPIEYISDRSPVKAVVNGYETGNTYYIGQYDSMRFHCKVTAYDKMIYARQYYADIDGRENKEISSSAVLNKIAEAIGAELDIIDISYSFDMNTDDLYSLTLEDILKQIALVNGGNFAIINDKLTFLKFGEDRTTYEFADNDHTFINVGSRDNIYFNYGKVIVRNGNDTFEYGDGDKAHTLEISSKYCDEAQARELLRIMSGVNYKSFRCDKCICPIDLEVGDKAVFSYENPGDIFTITSYTKNMTCAGCFAFLNSDEQADVRNAFVFETPRKKELKNKLEKDKKYSSVKIGDKYGFTSSGKTSAGRSVGAAAITQKQELQIDNAEITMKDVTEESPVEAGKIYLDNTDTQTKSINMKMNGLLTNAQDVRGAINELFQEGAEVDDDWVRPSDWPERPIVNLDDDIYFEYFLLKDMKYINLNFFGVNTTELIIDWGDGSIDKTSSIINNGLERFFFQKYPTKYGPSLSIDHKYSAVGYYWIKVTWPKTYNTSMDIGRFGICENITNSKWSSHSLYPKSQVIYINQDEYRSYTDIRLDNGVSELYFYGKSVITEQQNYKIYSKQVIFHSLPFTRVGISALSCCTNVIVENAENIEYLDISVITANINNRKQSNIHIFNSNKLIKTTINKASEHISKIIVTRDSELNLTNINDVYINAPNVSEVLFADKMLNIKNIEIITDSDLIVSAVNAFDLESIKISANFFKKLNFDYKVYENLKEVHVFSKTKCDYNHILINSDCKFSNLVSTFPKIQIENNMTFSIDEYIGAYNKGLAELKTLGNISNISIYVESIVELNNFILNYLPYINNYAAVHVVPLVNSIEFKEDIRQHINKNAAEQKGWRVMLPI